MEDLSLGDGVLGDLVLGGGFVSKKFGFGVVETR